MCVQVPCMGHHRDVVGFADGIMSDKDMCTCGEAVRNVNSAMMRTDRWSI